MAKVIKRKWLSRGPTGRKVKRIAWGYTIQVDGKQERHFDARWTSQDALDALSARLLDRGVRRAPVTPKTFGEVIQEYLEVKRAKGKRSIRDDEHRLGRMAAWFGTDTLLPEVTAQRIAQYDRDRVTQISRRKRQVSPATVNRELSILRHLLRLAEEWGYIEKVPKIRLSREPEGRLRFLSEEEIVRLLGACHQSKNQYLHGIVTLALNTGMRKGEVMGLTWEHVDFSRGVLLLDQTKSGRRREVPMNRAVYDALSELPGPKEEGLLFRRRNGAAWGNIRTAFENACSTAKVHDFRFHDLRHTCASWLIMRGRSLKEVQELLGHREFNMTLRYAHLSPDRLRDAVASLEGLAATSGQGQETPAGADARSQFAAPPATNR
jgi:integrase